LELCYCPICSKTRNCINIKFFRYIVGVLELCLKMLEQQVTAPSKKMF